MTSRDSWIVEQAQKKKAAALQGKPQVTVPLKGNSAVDDLWTSLQRETVRLAGLYNDALGEPAVSVTAEGDVIDIKATDGRQLIVSLDRTKPGFTERFRNASGVTRLGAPRIQFATNSTGELGFSFGGVQEAAGSLLRRMIG